MSLHPTGEVLLSGVSKSGIAKSQCASLPPCSQHDNEILQTYTVLSQCGYRLGECKEREMPRASIRIDRDMGSSSGPRTVSRSTELVNDIKLPHIPLFVIHFHLIARRLFLFRGDLIIDMFARNALRVSRSQRLARSSFPAMRGMASGSSES